MSLIQEALKRKREEEQAVPPPEGTASPLSLKKKPDSPVSAVHAETATAVATATLPPPPPPQPATSEAATSEAEDPEPRVAPEPAADSEEEKSRKRAWPALVGALVVMMVLIAGGAWMVLYAYQQWQQTRDAEPALLEETLATLNETAQGPLPPADSAEAPGQTDELSGAAAVTPVDGADQTASGGLAAKGTPGPTEAGNQALGPKTGSIPAGSASLTGEPGDPAAGSDPEEDVVVQWPLLTLRGVIGDGQEGAAIIDGEVVAVGESYQEVRVAGVGPRLAKLEYMGEQRTIKVGSSTD